MNSRRKLVIALGVGALTAPLGSFAQQSGKVWRVGFLALPSRPADLDSHYFGAFRHGLRDLGYVEGKNLIIEWRFADSDVKRLPGLAAELVQLKVDLIAAAGNDAPRAAQKATSTIPIVMTSAADPLTDGLVSSLARPGGNTTGRSDMGGELAPKRLEMLLAMTATAAPKVSRVAVLVNAAAPRHAVTLKSVQAAGLTLGVEILPFDARTPQEIDHAAGLMRQRNAGALIVLNHPFFQQQRSQIAQLAAKHRLPTMTPDRIYVEAGCLMSYGPSLADNIRRSAIYVDKIFKGAKPSDLPVEQPTKVELMINGKTAKALGLTIPQSLLVIADKVIE